MVVQSNKQAAIYGFPYVDGQNNEMTLSAPFDILAVILHHLQNYIYELEQTHRYAINTHYSISLQSQSNMYETTISYL